MAIPSGTGTEVLKTLQITNDSSGFVDLLGGGNTAAYHIYTVLSIIICNPNATNDVFSMQVGANKLLEQESVPAKSTYVWNDKFCVIATADLQVWNDGVTLHYYCSYIDQDWT